MLERRIIVGSRAGRAVVKVSFFRKGSKRPELCRGFPFKGFSKQDHRPKLNHLGFDLGFLFIKNLNNILT